MALLLRICTSQGFPCFSRVSSWVQSEVTTLSLTTRSNLYPLLLTASSNEHNRQPLLFDKNLFAKSFSTSNFQCREENKNKNAIVESRESPYAGLTPGQKVKEAGKDATYTGVILVGLGLLGVLAYAVGRELFSSSSPSGIYGKALKLCKQNTQIIDALGEPIKGYGETTRRGRRRHVSHIEFMENGVKHLRMKFYIEGVHKKGTVTLESEQNESGKYETRFIYVELDGYPPRTIVVEDNR